jgi:hypothetical protein
MAPSPPTTDRLFTEREAADFLNVSAKTLQRWRWAGHPPAFHKIGATVRYSLVDLRAFIEAGRRTSTSDQGKAA